MLTIDDGYFPKLNYTALLLQKRPAKDERKEEYRIRKETSTKREAIK